ncbi:YraN family protein [soil metagenome]
MKLDTRTSKRILGDLGETIAAEYLLKHGFEILDKNYLRKWGEIDIVAKKNDLIRFVEVKSVSCVTLPEVTQETKDWFRPEDNVHPQKLKRLARTMQTYLLEKRIDLEWQLDLITVKISQNDRMARVEMIENIII